MSPALDVGLLLDLLCLGKRLPSDPRHDVAQQWRALSRAPGLPALVAYEGAELWLYRQLHAQRLESAPGFDERLRLAAHRDSIRGIRIDDEAVAVLGTLRDAGVPCVLIKGQARRAAVSIYPWADARTSSDVDLLVPADRAAHAWDLLIAAGYTPAVDPSRSYAGHFHLTPVWSGRGVAVELHTSTSPEVPAAEAWRRALDQADALTWSGVEVIVPSATELLWHGMAHALLDGPAALRLRSLLVGAIILASGRPIDWDRIHRRVHAGEVREGDTGFPLNPEVQHAWLAVAARLAGTELPPLPGMGHSLPMDALLRWRHRVLGARLGRAARERLLDEAARSELRLPLMPSAPTVAAWKRARRFVSTATARACYRGWRATAS